MLSYAFVVVIATGSYFVGVLVGIIAIIMWSDSRAPSELDGMFVKLRSTYRQMKRAA